MFHIQLICQDKIPISSDAFCYVGLDRLPPWMGSAPMAASSLFVCLNALRINLFDINKITENKHNNFILPPEVLEINILTMVINILCMCLI